MSDMDKQTPVLVDLPSETVNKLDSVANQLEKSREEKARDIIIAYIEKSRE